MSSSELRSLADHMGHNLNIHMNHYALQTNIIERTKVARVLSAISNGHWKDTGVPKQLEEIIVNDVDVMNDEDGG